MLLISPPCNNLYAVHEDVYLNIKVVLVLAWLHTVTTCNRGMYRFADIEEQKG